MRVILICLMLSGCATGFDMTDGLQDVRQTLDHERTVYNLDGDTPNICVVKMKHANGQVLIMSRRMLDAQKKLDNLLEAIK